MVDDSVELERPAPPRDCTAPWAHTEFSLKLFVQLVRAAPGKNVFLSPAGVAAALLVLSNGADPGTRQAIAGVVGLKDPDLQALNSAAGSWLDTLLRPERGQETIIATSLWLPQGLTLDGGFSANVRRYYGADIETGADAARMNAWVSRKTGGRITETSVGGDSRDALTILNAVYFKGAWVVPFDPRNTEDGVFTRSDGSSKKLPMMSRKGMFAYLGGPGFKAVHLVYSGKNFGMYIIVPDGPLQDFIAGLNAGNWEDWRRHFRFPRYGDLVLPRFRIDYHTSLNPALKDLGFDPAAGNFQGMSPSLLRPWVDEVSHSTFCIVDEAGTEAGALTEIMVLGMGCSVEADRPFLCAIENERTGSLIFLGAIEDPQ